jgi:putative membrane protein
MTIIDVDHDGVDDWRRLSPLTLLLAIIKLGPKSLNMIPAVAAIGITSDWRYAALALLAFVCISLGFAWAAWVRFRWRIGGDAIVIESGVFDRQHRTIPFDRIQDVSIEQGLVARALGLAKVGFETGASAEADKGDGGLDAITVEDAAALRGTIRDWRSGAAAAMVTSPELAAAGELVPVESELFRLTPRRLILAGLFNFSLAALAIAGAATQWFDDFLPFKVFDPRGWADLARETGVESWVTAHLWATGFLALGGLLLVGFGTGLVRTALVNWNFLLSLGPRALRRVRGLTTRTDVAVPLARVQAAVVATGIIRRRWGWHELRVQSLASDGKDEKDHQLIPFGQLDDIDAVLRPIGMARPDTGLAWHNPSLWAQALGALVLAAVLALAGATTLVVAFSRDAGDVIEAGRWTGPALLIAAGLLAIAAVLAAGRHRWAEGGGFLYIWKGWWSPRLTILPFANVQSADLADGPILRALGCVRLELGVPGESTLASHDIVAVPVAEALRLRRDILRARSTRAGAPKP